MKTISWYLTIYHGEGKKGKDLPQNVQVPGIALSHLCQKMATWSHKVALVQRWRRNHRDKGHLKLCCLETSAPCQLHCGGLGIAKHIPGEKKRHEEQWCVYKGYRDLTKFANGLRSNSRYHQNKVIGGGDRDKGIKTLCKLVSNNYPLMLHLFQGILSFIKNQVVLDMTPKAQATKQKLVKLNSIKITTFML